MLTSHHLDPLEHISKHINDFTHWNLDKIVTILKMTFSNLLSGMKIVLSQTEFHWNLVPVNNKPALVQIMAWRQLGVKLLSEARKA